MDEYLYKDLYDLEETHWWHKAKRDLTVSLIKKFAPVTKHLKIIDIGCGTGKNVEVFSRFGESWGIDTSPAAIAFCKKRGLSNIVLSEGEKTPFENNSFDVVTMLDVLEHADDQKVIAEIKRILKPGGIVIANVPAYQFMWSQWDTVLHHKRRYTTETLKKLLVSGGFQLELVSFSQSFLLFPVYIIRRLKEIWYKNKTYESDFRTSFPGMHTLLSKFALIERSSAVRGKIPFGLSVVAVAKKV